MIHFKIGLTFSGQYREQYVEPICNVLLGLGYTKNDIFYDEWHDVLINGVSGDVLLRKIYYECCDCVVVLLSPDYKERHWTGNIEWRAIRELINTGGEGKICLLSVDSANIGEIEGLCQYQAIAKSVDGLRPGEIAEFIDAKYKLIKNGWDTYTGATKETVIQLDTMTIYNYMCDVMHIEACIDCSNFKNWKCIGDHDIGDKQCLELLGVTYEDIINGEHPNLRIWREIQNKLRNI